MGTSNRLSIRESRACSALVEHCRVLGADGPAWERTLIEGLCHLLDARVGIVGNMRNFASDRPVESIRSIRHGWDDDDAARLWTQYATTTPVERTPEYPLLSQLQERLVTRTRASLWPKTLWYRSKTYNEVHKPAGLDDYIISIRRQPGVRIQHSVWVHRAVGDAPFTKRDWWKVHYVHELVGRSIGGELAGPTEPEMGTLTRRQREVLDLLLDGDSEKQIARAMGIGRATVHEHILAVYRHFNASSRGELMAWFVGRARPPRPRQ